MSRTEHPLPSWWTGMGKPVSWRHACIFLESQPSLDSFKTSIPETALEADPSEAPADSKLGVLQLLGLD